MGEQAAARKLLNEKDVEDIREAALQQAAWRHGFAVNPDRQLRILRYASISRIRTYLSLLPTHLHGLIAQPVRAHA